jgi:L,D-peptidoglycan transpeptidase YkuD (ErfK/YbiS/YcfS/YnhG family)
MEIFRQWEDWGQKKMASFRTLYRWLIVIQQNQKRKPSAGSCIFLHFIPRYPSSTAGCTALMEPSMIELMKWLKKTPKPIYVALPLREWEILRKPWELPLKMR